MKRIFSTASTEFRIALRNRWVTIALVLMAVFSLVLSLAGSAPTGGLGVDRLSVTVASLTSLSVYLIPLLALLISFDAIAGEAERGTLPLLLAYPIAREEVLIGKMAAHLAILALAVLLGHGLAAGVAIWSDESAVEGLPALWRLSWSSVLLGATFLGAGYALSSLSRRPSGAAGLAIGLWLGLVVLYDIAILAAIVVIWCTVPALWVLCLPDVPMAHRRAAALSFGRASLRGLLMLPADLLAEGSNTRTRDFCQRLLEMGA